MALTENEKDSVNEMNTVSDIFLKVFCNVANNNYTQKYSLSEACQTEDVLNILEMHDIQSFCIRELGKSHKLIFELMIANMEKSINRTRPYR